MAASPHLSRKIRDTLGNEAGEELIGILDKLATDISDLRGDIAEFRHQTDVRFTRLEERIEGGLAGLGGDIEKVKSDMTAAIEKAMREQTRFFFVAWAVILAAIVGIYTRS